MCEVTVAKGASGSAVHRSSRVAAAGNGGNIGGAGGFRTHPAFLGAHGVGAGLTAVELAPKAGPRGAFSWRSHASNNNPTPPDTSRRQKGRGGRLAVVESAIRNALRSEYPQGHA